MKITINEGFAGVLTEKGVFKSLLKPGRHTYSSVFRHQNVEIVDMRLMGILTSASATTADNILLSASVNFSYRVIAPRAYLTTSQNPLAYFIIEANNILSILISGINHDQLEQTFTQKTELILKELNDKLRPIGIEALTMAKPSITLPKNIRNALDAQVAAKSKSLADLEEARGRTAVLRHYANTADIIKDKPEIMQLMLGQKAKNIHIDFSNKNQ